MTASGRHEQRTRTSRGSGTAFEGRDYERGHDEDYRAWRQAQELRLDEDYARWKAAQKNGRKGF